LETKQITVNVGKPMYESLTALRQLLGLEGTEAHIVEISPRGYTLENGLDYCCVGIKSRDGTGYSVQAYGKEALELFSLAMVLRH
jgi:hypothetical protein